MLPTLREVDKERILKTLGLPSEIHGVANIKNKSEHAIIYRNIRRKEVDTLFERKNNLLSLVKSHPDQFPDNAEIWRQMSQLDFKARQLWRDVVMCSNEM